MNEKPFTQAKVGCVVFVTRLLALPTLLASAVEAKKNLQKF